MEVHIGEQIERIYQKSGMKLSEFSDRINTSSRNIYSIFSRKEIKTDQLQKISEVLNFNFFSLFTLEEGQPMPEEGQTLPAEEPVEPYKKGETKVTISIELDGREATLENHIRTLRSINQSLAKS